MNIYSVIAIYFVTWWIVLLAVLPFGVRTQDESGDVTLGTSHSAPMRPMLIRKAIATSIVAAIIVGSVCAAIIHYGITVEMIANLIDMKQ